MSFYSIFMGEKNIGESIPDDAINDKGVVNDVATTVHNPHCLADRYNEDLDFGGLG